MSIKKRGVCIFIFIILFLNFVIVSARIEIGNASGYFELTYAPNDQLRGWINISLDKEPSDSLLECENGCTGNIKILKFLEESNVNYNCIPSNCEYDYSKSNEVSQVSLTLGQTKYLGFYIKGDLAQPYISKFSFKFSSNAESSCLQPLEIDLLDDEVIEWKVKSVENDFSCGKIQGCFKQGNTEGPISQVKRCEKMNLTEAGKYRIGAWIGKSTPSNALFKMELYDSSRGLLDDCEINENQITSDGEYYCDVEPDENVFEKGEYYVCISANKTTNYKIKVDNTNDICGFRYTEASGFEEVSVEYGLFAKPYKFSSVGSLIFDDNLLEWEEGDLIEYVKNYIINRYNANCTSGCIIPLKIKPGKNQDLTFSDIDIVYETKDIGKKTNKIYNIDTISAKVSSSFQKIDLQKANFIVAGSYGNYTTKVKLHGDVVYKQKIIIAKVPIITSLTPLGPPAGISVTFTAKVTSPANNTIKNYHWNFGDDTEIDTTIENVSHKYNNVGIYDLKLTVTDSEGMSSSKTFKIQAGSPREIANYIINRDFSWIANVSKELSNLLSSAWYKDKLIEKVDLVGKNSSLKVLKKEYDEATTESDYVNITNKLSNLKIPYSFRKIEASSIPGFIDSDAIDLDSLKVIGAGNYETGKEEKYKDAIASWFFNNMESTINYEKYGLFYQDGVEIVASVFSISLNPKTNVSEIYLIIVEDINNVIFDKSYGEENIEGDIGIILSESKTIKFTVFDDRPAENLVFYLSPKFSELNLEVEIECNNDGTCDSDIGENWKNCRADCKPLGKVITWFIILIVLGFFVYLGMNEWYKRRYESHLFKDRNQLYNLISFIDNAKAQNMSEKEFIRKLKEVGWNSEQINYAIKRFKGKRISGLAFSDIFSKRKVNKPIMPSK